MNTRRVGDRADELSAVRVEDFDLGCVRNIEPSRRTVDRDAIRTTDAANRLMARDLVTARAFKQHGAEDKNG